MNFFQKLEAKISEEYHSFLTPSVTAVIAGQIAQVNLDPLHADKSGAEKHFIVAGLIASIFKIGEAVAHALVKIAFNALAAKTPDVLKPIEQQVEEAVQGMVTQEATTLTQTFQPAAPLHPPTPQAGVLQTVLASAPLPLAPT